MYLSWKNYKSVSVTVFESNTKIGQKTKLNILHLVFFNNQPQFCFCQWTSVMSSLQKRVWNFKSGRYLQKGQVGLLGVSCLY